jgi:hypothetical protein
MNLLAPWYVPAVAASLVVPPLVLLYFLKLKRRQMPIASTLLWKRAVHDLQVNSPFQRLRNNLLLILQLLALLAAILAISEPILSGRRGSDKATVLLIDQSASMGTKEPDGRTRLAIAQDLARRLVDGMESNQRAMIIAFAERARVLTPFTEDHGLLRRAIEDIRQTDAPSRLREAVQLAEAHSTPAGEITEISSSHYVLLTDGRLPDSGEVTVERGDMAISRIGTETENVGIVGLDVRRNYDRPELVSVLIRVRNFGAAPAKRDITLVVDNQVKDVQGLPQLAPLATKDRLPQIDLSGSPPEGSEATVSFELNLENAARIEVRLSGSDGLKIDDQAFAVVTPPRSINALLVSPGNRFLKNAVASVLDNKFEVWQPDKYEEARDNELIEDGKCRYNVVILDGHSTRRLPPGGYLFFGATPLIEGVDMTGMVTGQPLLDWDETHPVLRHVGIESMTLFSWHKLQLPSNAKTLIEGASGPVMSLLSRDRNEFLLCAFSLFDEERTHLNTDWVYQDGLVVFMSNALRYLSGSSTIGQQPSARPGYAFTVGAKPGVRSLNVRRPDGKTDSVPVLPSGLFTYGQTDRVGFYEINTGVPGEDARAVNLLDENESLIAINGNFRIAAGDLKTTQASEQVNRALWPWLLGALGIILLIEWIIYNKRVFV